MVTADSNKILHYFLFTLTAGVFAVQKASAQHGTTIDEQTLDPSYFFYRQSENPRDCKEVQDRCTSSNSSGIYYIKPDGYPEPFQVPCGTVGDSTGWTIIQRRGFGGIISFGRSWEDYKKGFGFLSHEYWIGNERLSFLTNQKDYKISIEMILSNGSIARVSYNNFRIGDEFSDYRLYYVAQYEGTTDAFTWISCPNNMVHGSCTCGQRSCQEPSVCQNTCEADKTNGCICPEGFLMDGEDCVPVGDCGCYLAEEDTVISEGVTYVDDRCTRVAVCSGGRLTRDGPYECSSDATCEERDGVRKCYCNEGYVGDGETCSLPTDCMDVYEAGFTDSGVYSVTPTNWRGSAFDVYCNMTNGGGWTVLQRRTDGGADFFLDWQSYKRGFGDENGEFWIGNDKIHHLTYQKRYKVRIDLVNHDHDQYYAEFDYFRVDNEDALYRLSGLGTYSGDADERSSADGDYILGHGRNRGFSTKDRDNDAVNYVNLAVYYKTAWWFGSDYYRDSINGQSSSDHFGVGFLPGDNDLYFSEIKIRPV